ncbi:MAG: bifunctional heptose 7-phosphate kinase/heptose 1-phosphate adenyltransferase, partial [Bacteroidales bacterium]|nr:bifunctional heptose 7-phosphate kinase/heptose 1-phosphate adenyltransferase [Bacteroidales bacterium]
NQDIENLVITLSEYGILVSEKDEFTIIPAEKRDITDVSGAGDTVISVLTLCAAFGCSLPDAARLANLAGGLVCEKVGVVPIDRSQLMDEALAIFS